MLKTCRFDHCRHGFLEKSPSDLSRDERIHLMRYHKQGIYSIGIHGAVFIFRRDPSQNNRYVCFCGKSLASTGTLTIHVKGFTRPTNHRNPCSIIGDKAISIAKTKEVLDDPEKPVNFHPAISMMENDLMDIDSPNNVRHNDDGDHVGTNNDDDDFGSNNDDYDVGTNSEIEEEVNNGGDNEVDPRNSMLKAEILRLGLVIEQLQQARSNMEKTLRSTPK